MNTLLIKNKIDWRRSSLFAVLLVFACSLVYYYYSRLIKDFRDVKSVLSDVRFRAIEQDREITAQLIDKQLVIKDSKADQVNQEIDIPTLHRVNYDTTLGKDIIVFTGRGTGQYNTRIHGGDLTLKSWLGFKRHIAVNCTGLVREGTYPNE